MTMKCHDNEEWCKTWRGIDLSVQSWHGDFEKFWSKHSKIPKIYFLKDCFWSKYITSALKKYKGVTFNNSGYWCKVWMKTDK